MRVCVICIQSIYNSVTHHLHVYSVCACFRAVKKFAMCLMMASGAGCASGANVPATQFDGTITTDAGALTSCSTSINSFLLSGCPLIYICYS